VVRELAERRVEADVAHLDTAVLEAAANPAGENEP
jgi:hypothetical protein